ncbi:MAG: radical SAM protein [Balneolaceae bacterium]
MPEITNRKIIEQRPPKESVDPFVPINYLHEKEIQADGVVRSVNTIFLTNRECPFKCTMCDLWRHTLDESTPKGAIPEQIRYALKKLPEADVIKLYNSGNFFDGKAIPKSDYDQIAELLSDVEHVVVENHPALTNKAVLDFFKLLNGTFEIAMGLETIHPLAMPMLNKQITKELFSNAVGFLNEAGISSRAFILLNPPFITDPEENQRWCLESLNFAFQAGVSACTIIPTRSGNGIMEDLQSSGKYIPPKLKELEKVFDSALQSSSRSRVFCDTWDLQLFSDCGNCLEKRTERLNRMNLTQKLLPPIGCSCNSAE